MRKTAAHEHGSVRMGPISIFTLVVVLCLAVLAVLTVATARASLASAERQAAFTHDTYVNETVAQEFVSAIDEELASIRGSGATRTAVIAAISKALPTIASRANSDDVSVGANMENGSIVATFTTNNNRCLDVVLSLKSNATYEIVQWKATTQWNEDGSGDVLWLGQATQTTPAA